MESRFITNLTDGWIINGEMVLAHYDPPVFTTAPAAYVDEGWLAATGLRLATKEEAETYEKTQRQSVIGFEGGETVGETGEEMTEGETAEAAPDPDPAGPPVELAEPEPAPEPHRRGRK